MNSASEEEEENRKYFGRLVTFWVGTFAIRFHITGLLVVIEALEDEWYVKKFAIFEILRDFSILRVCAIPTNRVYHLYDILCRGKYQEC